MNSRVASNTQRYIAKLVELFTIRRSKSEIPLSAFVGIKDLLKLTHSSGGSRIFPGGGRQLPKLLLFFTFLPKTA